MLTVIVGPLFDFPFCRFPGFQKGLKVMKRTVSKMLVQINSGNQRNDHSRKWAKKYRSSSGYHPWGLEHNILEMLAFGQCCNAK